MENTNPTATPAAPSTPTPTSTPATPMPSQAPAATPPEPTPVTTPESPIPEAAPTMQPHETHHMSKIIVLALIAVNILLALYIVVMFATRMQ